MAGAVTPATGTEVVAGLVADLRDEAAVLQSLLADLTPAQWSAETPAVGWSVQDQVSHLAHFDGVTRMCIATPEEFIAFRDGLDDLQTYVDGVGESRANMSGEEMLAWWTEENDGVTTAALAADPTVRVPWFGPSMSLASKVTARIMETWAHGQDVVDAIGAQRESTDRLKNVARIGVLAFPNSYRTHGLEVPDTLVRVELTGPSGDAWVWGSQDATDVVRGSALDFCLVVTQRRHVLDTRLETEGSVAEQWMHIAQAFAGPSGSGREPGQFRR